MTIKFFHLNILGGLLIDSVISYIKENDFDIVHLQEVGANQLSKNGSDNFLTLKNGLGYEGVHAPSETLKGDPSSYWGLATFFKPSLTFVQKEVVWLKPFAEIELIDHEEEERIKKLPHNALALKFKFPVEEVWFVNTHLTWGPTPKDEPYKVEQGMILRKFMGQLEQSFLLSGDFNVTKDSQIVKSLDEIGENHAVAAGLTNTLNPNKHRAPQLFPPGLAVDYIYTSFDLKARNFKLIETPDLSDHLGLSIEIDLLD